MSGDGDVRKNKTEHNVKELIKLTDNKVLVKIVGPMYIVTCEGNYETICETKDDAQKYVDNIIEELRPKMDIIEFDQFEIRGSSVI